MSNDLPLTELVLEVTNACHHNCIHCSTFGGAPLKDELTQEERMTLVSDACSLGMKELHLLGGDPLFRKQDTLELLMEANRHGVTRAVICTSAVEGQLDWITVLKDFAPIRVSGEASIFSASALIHDAITREPGSLDRLLASSREAVRVGFDLNWNFVWMKPNCTELSAVVGLASELGISRVRILRLMLNGRARGNRTLLELAQDVEGRCDDIIGTVTAQFPNVHLAYSKPLSFRLNRTRREGITPCGAGRGQLVVQADGTVLPCIGMKGIPEFVIGNIKHESIKDIFLRSRALQLPELSQDFHECPAILCQKDPQFVQLTLSHGRN